MVRPDCPDSHILICFSFQRSFYSCLVVQTLTCHDSVGIVLDSPSEDPPAHFFRCAQVTGWVSPFSTERWCPKVDQWIPNGGSRGTWFAQKKSWRLTPQCFDLYMSGSKPISHSFFFIKHPILKKNRQSYIENPVDFPALWFDDLAAKIWAESRRHIQARMDSWWPDCPGNGG